MIYSVRIRVNKMLRRKFLMDNWSQEQQNFIDKLEKKKSIFDDIIESDHTGHIIGEENKKLLDDMLGRNGKILRKLKNKEFSVAIVGLEKAGKSTLGNAILKLMVLPEYTERCTYTTTEIRAGKNDIGKIVFYNADEFNNDFISMLKALKYKGNEDFYSLDLNDFNAFWENMQTDDYATYMLYNGTVAEDVRTIIQGRSVIQSLLGQDVKEYIGDELKNSEFQRFITGIDGYYNNGAVIRSAHPYAVKRVNIQSKNLGDMQNMILYDVPGFDSPTNLHRKQTEDMLKKSDAIILVTNIGDNPNLNSPQLEMLRKGKDEDGIPLYEKAFVFGNKLDKNGNKQRALDNFAALENDAVNKYHIATEEHIVAGSAKAYLERMGIESADEHRRGAVHALDNLVEWQLSDGIEELIDKMHYYYNNDRFAVLKKRAENIFAEAKVCLNNILEETENEENFADAGNIYVVKLTDDIAGSGKALRTLSKKYQEYVGNSEKKPFSAKFIESIDNIFPYIQEDNEILLGIENDVLVDSDGNYPATRIESELRERLYTMYSNNVVRIIRNATVAGGDEVSREMVKTFLSEIGVKDEAENYQELFEEVEKEFVDILAEDGENFNFSSLVRRYTTTLLETLIKTQYGNRERLDKVLDNISEYVPMVANYEGNYDGIEEISDTYNKEKMIKLLSMFLDNRLNIYDVTVEENSDGNKEDVDEDKDDIETGKTGTSLIATLSALSQLSKSLK